MQMCTVLHANALPASYLQLNGFKWSSNGIVGITCAGWYLRVMQNCMHNIPFALSD